ncbi:hypothetical protein Tco_1487731, partial [Tanacetum coccineum]
MSQTRIGGEYVKGWLFQIEQFFEDNNIPDEGKFLSDNVKDSSCGLNVIGNVSDFSVNDSHYDVNLEKNEGSHKMFDKMSSKGKGFEVYDVYVKVSIEVGNRIVENVVVETAKADVEVENEVVDDDKVADAIKVKTSKSVDSKFMVMEVDRFVTDKNINQQRSRSFGLVGSGLRGRNTWRKVPQFSLMLEDKHHFKQDGFVRIHPDGSHVRGTMLLLHLEVPEV